MPLQKAPGRRGILATLLAADLAFAFQQTAVIPALPQVGRALDSSPTWTAWLLSGYLLTAAIATPLLGKLADQRGKRRVLLAAMLLFLAGSVGASIAPNIAVLIGFRAVQGAGGAIFPITLSIARDTLDPKQVGPAIGVLTGAFGAGTALGFALGGVLAQALTWRAIFAAGAIVVIAGTALVVAYIPAYRRVRGGYLDLPGGGFLGGGFATLLLALTLGVSLGWGAWLVVLLFGTSALLFGVWARREWVIAQPFINVRLLRSPTIMLTNLSTVALGYALFGTFFLLPHLVEAPGARLGYGFGATTIVAGLYLVPASAGQALGGPVAGNLARRIPAKHPYAAGMAVAALGTAALALWHQLPWQVLGATFMLGGGIGLAIGASSALVTEAVEAGETGLSTSLNTTLRRVGGGIGGQVGAALLAMYTDAGARFPDEPAFTVAFAVAALLCGVGAVLAALVPRGRT